jgi:hypothetical protein
LLIDLLLGITLIAQVTKLTPKGFTTSLAKIALFQT